MVEFRTQYYKPMDRSYHESVTDSSANKKLEDPIFPLSQIGETVPENLGGRNIIQTTQAAIRGGAGTLQIVLIPPPDTVGPGSVGSRIGKEVREAVKSIALANEVKIAGVELPTSLRGLSGFDFQQNAFSEEIQRKNLEQVKDAIKFTADVAQGGDVDLLSWEFPRNISDTGDKKFDDPSESQVGWVVDSRTGRTIPFRRSEQQWLPIDPKTFKKIEAIDKDGNPVLNPISWPDFIKYCEQYKKDNPTEKDIKEITPEVLYVKERFQAQMRQTQGLRSRYLGELENANALLKNLEDKKAAGTVEQAEYDKKKAEFTQDRADALAAAQGQQQEIQNVQDQIKNLQPIKKFGVFRSAEAYAEAGITAMQEYESGVKTGKVKHVISIGPEIGWPEYFGSHPDEFKEVIVKSRERMVEMLTNKFVNDAKGERTIRSDFFDEKLNTKQAEELAQKHIKGTFDTGHLGMWLAHFKGEPGWTEEKRIDKFNEWFRAKVEDIAKDPRKLVAGVQLVDSHSASHGHLPPGEGIFPVIDTAKIFKKAGFDGFIVSEGHEEERFGAGRIRMKTWEKLGSNLGSGYFGGPPMRWEPAGRSYFGKTYSPLFMFGSYAPSNDFKLWSEVPLE